MNLSPNDWNVVTNAMSVAATKFDENATLMRGWAEQYAAMSPEEQAKHDTGLVHGSAYAGLADVMENQAREVRELMEKIEDEDA